MYVCMYVCMYACMCVYIYIYIDVHMNYYHVILVTSKSNARIEWVILLFVSHVDTILMSFAHVYYYVRY